MKTCFQLFLAFICTLTNPALAGSPPGSFEFDMREDRQDAVVLAYRYGTSNEWIGKPQSPEGRVYWWDNLGTGGLQADFLYVKWRNRTTGAIFEDHVDLRSRLAGDLSDASLYFMIYADQLQVYLVYREPRQPDTPKQGPAVWSGRRVTKIYP